MVVGSAPSRRFLFTDPARSDGETVVMQVIDYARGEVYACDVHPGVPIREFIQEVLANYPSDLRDTLADRFEEMVTGRGMGTRDDPQ